MPHGLLSASSYGSRKTSEMLDLLRQMGVTAYMPRQRGNLQNPRPLPLTFSAEEKWWTGYASSEAGAGSRSKGHIKSVLSALDSLALEAQHELPTQCFPTMQNVAYALSDSALHWHGLDMCIKILVAIDCLLCTGKSLQSKIASSKINDQLTFPTTRWPNANGDKCTGITDSVSYVRPGCIKTCHCRHCDPHYQFCSFGSGPFHKQTARQFHH